MLEESWNRCWVENGTNDGGKKLMHRLIDAYSEPDRQYHTVQHLKECLNHLKEFARYSELPEEVELAIWFHDAIYDVRAQNNEEASAKWAVKELLNTSVSHDKIDRIRTLILATKHSSLPNGIDQEILIDIDLLILAAEEKRFREYEAQIRNEYSYVPLDIYRDKRRAVLLEFLARQRIYSTPVINERFEQRARNNIEQSIALLG
jgi:predicted metal-dependent HD superfamily phosphohydrolase